MSKELSLETITIMDEIIGFTKNWEKQISEKIVYPEIHIKINKYKSFIDYDRTKFKKTINRTMLTIVGNGLSRQGVDLNNIGEWWGMQCSIQGWISS